MRRFNKLAALALTLGGASLLNAADFQVKFTNYGPQPVSPVFWAATNDQYNLFSVGAGASFAIKRIAEGGNTTQARADADSQLGGSVAAYGVLGGAPIAPGGMVMGEFSTDSSHSYFSFAAMLGKTNDGFIGESVNSLGLQLFSGGNPHGWTHWIMGSRAWDAGTELNTQSSADLGFLGGSGNPAEAPNMNTVHVHPGIVAGVGDAWDQMPNWTRDTVLGRIEVSPVPEPAGLAVLGLGFVAIARKRRALR